MNQRNLFDFEPDQVGHYSYPIARQTDPVTSQIAATEAATKAGRIHQTIAEWLSKQSEPLTAREIAEGARGWILSVAGPFSWPIMSNNGSTKPHPGLVQKVNNMSRAFYSVVQYCPDRFRAEAVNIGLILLCLDPHDVRVRMTNNLSRARKLFRASKVDLKNLELTGKSLVSRVEGSVCELVTEQDLVNFAASRANDFRLTEPRLTKIKQIDEDFERLFAELVDEKVVKMLADNTLAQMLPPVLGNVFDRLSKSQKICEVETIRKRVGELEDLKLDYRVGIAGVRKCKVTGKLAETWEVIK